MDPRLVVVSIDGLSSVDLAQLEGLPNFRELMERGSICREMRGIYPTQTYPLHASLITGCYPHQHGVRANTLFQPGRASPDWYWYSRFLQVPPLYDLATRAGLTTATILWPGAAGSANRYVIPEIKPTRPGQNLVWLLATSGRSLFMLYMGLRYHTLLKSLEYVHLDNFTSAVAAHLIQRRKPNLLLLHLLDLDATRHRRGFRSPEVEKVLEDQDRRLGTLLSAARSSGIFEQTTFVVFGDHAYIDANTRVRINAALRRAGLIEIDGKGKLRSWKAWVNCCEGSAQVYLRDSSDRVVHRALADVFADLQDRKPPVIDTVYGEAEIREMKIGNDIDYVLEAAAGCYFVAEMEGDTVSPGEEGFKAVHGYHPQRPGYTSLLLLAGAGIRPGVELKGVCIVDLGPTLAHILGLQLPAAEGRILTEVLKFQ